MWLHDEVEQQSHDRNFYSLTCWQNWAVTSGILGQNFQPGIRVLREIQPNAILENAIDEIGLTSNIYSRKHGTTNVSLGARLVVGQDGSAPLPPHDTRTLRVSVVCTSVTTNTIWVN